jgi:hypothetical protein
LSTPHPAAPSTRIALALAVVWLGCAHAPPRIQADPLAGPTPWTSLAPRDAAEDFRFVLVTDRTGGHRGDVFEQALPKINLLEPAFVLSVGDLIEGYSEDRTELDAMWDELEGFVARLKMPFFHAAGNHDFSNEVMSHVWRERFGPSYYHFRYKDVLFLILNSELFSSVSHPGHPVPGPDTQAQQLAYAQEVLVAHRDARWTIVLVHQPLWDRREVPADWLALESWLGDRPYTVFAGHVHRYTKEVRRDRRYITLATTGGRSQLRGLDYGEFDHVAQVTMTDEGPVIANLLLDGIHGEDVRTREVRDRLTQLERALATEPFLAEDGFESGSARFSVSNESDRPLEVEAQVHSGPDLIATPTRLVGVVAPGASDTFEVDVSSREAKAVGAMAPSPITWTLRGEKPDGSSLEVEHHSWVIPETRFVCPRAAGPLEVDGSLEDWATLPFLADARPLPPGSPEGTSFRFGVAYDEDFLYVAVDVTDPSPFSSSTRTSRDQDAIVVEIDARPEPERDQNESFFGAVRSGTVASLVIAWLTPGEAREDPIFGVYLAELPEGTRHAARRTATGYAAELAIPVAFLDERQTGPWQGFRLNVSVQDYDRDGASHATHWWRPSRFGLTGAEPAAGSGSFSKR